AIIIRDSPQKVAAAEQLVHELDRSKAEVVMEVSVVEADRDRARDLGLYPATVSSSGTATAGLQSGLVYSPSTTSPTTLGSPLTWSSLRSDYALVVPSAAANAILNDTR